MSATPVVPAVLVEPVLDRDQREAVGEVSVELDHRVRVERPPLAGKVVLALAEHLARGRIERDPDPLTVSRALRGVENRLDRILRRREVRREAALVADSGGEPPLVEHRPQRVEHLRADAQRLREALGPRGDDHELLQVEPVLRVRAAVDHVHQRHGQRASRLATEGAVQRLAGVGSRGLRDSEGAAEDCVRTEPALVRRSVELDQDPVELALVGGIETDGGARDLAVHVGDRAEHALAEVHGRVAVSKLHCLVLAGGRA